MPCASIFGIGARFALHRHREARDLVNRGLKAVEPIPDEHALAVFHHVRRAVGIALLFNDLARRVQRRNGRAAGIERPAADVLHLDHHVCFFGILVLGQIRGGTHLLEKGILDLHRLAVAALVLALRRRGFRLRRLRLHRAALQPAGEILEAVRLFRRRKRRAQAHRQNERQGHSSFHRRSHLPCEKNFSVVFSLG